MIFSNSPLALSFNKTVESGLKNEIVPSSLETTTFIFSVVNAIELDPSSDLEKFTFSGFFLTTSDSLIGILDFEHLTIPGE